MSQNKRSNGFAMYAWGVLAFNLGVILWGAYVRASGSGAGCGSHWPLCNGEVLPRSNSVQTLIEFTHRMTSGLSVLLIAGLIVFAYIRFPKKHLARPGALATGFFILTEAAVGAGLVLFELVAHNASVARALFISVHLLNTFLLLGALTLTAWWGSGGPAIYLRRQGWFLLVIGSAIITTLVVGISGAVTALGDTLFPASSLAQGISQDFSSAANFLIRLRLIHPVIAISSGLFVMVVCAVTRHQRPGSATRLFSLLLPSIIALQILVGAVNVFLLAPVPIQLIHLLLADLMWVVLVLMTASALGTEREDSRAEQWVKESVPEVAA